MTPEAAIASIHQRVNARAYSRDDQAMYQRYRRRFADTKLEQLRAQRDWLDGCAYVNPTYRAWLNAEIARRYS